jgi:hypothetical protein
MKCPEQGAAGLDRIGIFWSLQTRRTVGHRMIVKPFIELNFYLVCIRAWYNVFLLQSTNAGAHCRANFFFFALFLYKKKKKNKPKKKKKKKKKKNLQKNERHFKEEWHPPGTLTSYNGPKTACKYGEKCYQRSNGFHMSRFTHPGDPGHASPPPPAAAAAGQPPARAARTQQERRAQEKQGCRCAVQ